jgi:acyl-CoA reductase-like NAD-dependent aldehyde dehydrogenase
VNHQEKAMTEYSMTIDGKAVRADATFDVTNPATGRLLATAPDCSAVQVDTAMQAAIGAFGEWRRDEELRRDALRKAAQVLLDAQSDLAHVLSAEQGKPLGSTSLGDANFEVFGCSVWMQYYADFTIPREVIQDDETALVEVLRKPLGVVAAITPWNFPLLLACFKIAPALLAGNTMVLKPSPYTPLATLRMGELLSTVLPPGVLNVISGGDHVGAGMTEHPAVRKISFTGSVATGVRVAQAAAPDLKRVTLELGGNDPAIVLDDADPAAVAEGIFWGAFTNCGQVCSAVKRVYVPKHLYAQVVDALAAQARAAKVGVGTEEGTQIGPINNRPQFDRVARLVQDALGRGARAVAGGAPRGGDGFFFAPTILVDADDGMAIVDEEQFGPALPVISYTDLEDALRRANATHFGLSGSVWGADPDRAARVAAKLECGTAWVNTHLAVGPHQPFGGFKWSGIGRENGIWGLDSFTDVQVLHRPAPVGVSS